MENFESRNLKKAEQLTEGFRNLRFSENPESSVFTNLENTLSEAGFTLADNIALSQIFNTNTLLCRSEALTRVVDLMTDETPIEIPNTENHANMCAIASSKGFKVAMTEGFSGKEVAGVVTTVITFRGEHLTAREMVPSSDALWKTKPKTAEVSLVGRGEVTLDDVEMISFRFPIHMFPEEKLTETEREQLDDAGIQFVVRHYIPDHKKATH